MSNSDYDYTRTTGTPGTTGTTGATGSGSTQQREAGQQATERVDSAMTATGERMTGLAQTLREKAPEGQAGEVAYNAARALERGGDYLQRADPTMVRSDLENVIRDHPIEALAISLGIGFLIGKSMSNRRSYYG